MTVTTDAAPAGDTYYVPSADSNGSCYHAANCGAHLLEPVSRDELLERVNDEGLSACQTCVEHNGLTPVGLADRLAHTDNVLEVKLEGVQLTLHLPLDAGGDLAAAIEDGLLESPIVRYVDATEIGETYQIEKY